MQTFSFTLRSLYPRERTLGAHRSGQAGCKVSADVMKESVGNRNTIPTAHSLVTTLTELLRLFNKEVDF